MLYVIWMYCCILTNTIELPSRTRATQRRVPYKWRNISQSSLVIICIFDLENEGLGHWVQLLQCHHSMTNIKIFKRLIWHFCASSHHFQDINTSDCHSMPNIRIYKVIFHIFCTTFYYFRDLHSFYLENVGEKYVKVMKYNFHNDAIRWQIS